MVGFQQPGPRCTAPWREILLEKNTSETSCRALRHVPWHAHRSTVWAQQTAAQKPAQHLKMWAKERTVLQKVNKIKNIPDQELRKLPPDVKEDLDTHFSGILSNHSDLRKSIEPFNRQDRRL